MFPLLPFSNGQRLHFQLDVSGGAVSATGAINADETIANIATDLKSGQFGVEHFLNLSAHQFGP